LEKRIDQLEQRLLKLENTPKPSMDRIKLIHTRLAGMDHGAIAIVGDPNSINYHYDSDCVPGAGFGFTFGNLRDAIVECWNTHHNQKG
jgi:hypothetical protein